MKTKVSYVRTELLIMRKTRLDESLRLGGGLGGLGIIWENDLLGITYGSRGQHLLL